MSAKVIIISVLKPPIFSKLQIFEWIRLSYPGWSASLHWNKSEPSKRTHRSPSHFPAVCHWNQQWQPLSNELLLVSTGNCKSRKFYLNEWFKDCGGRSLSDRRSGSTNVHLLMLGQGLSVPLKVVHIVSHLKNEQTWTRKFLQITTVSTQALSWAMFILPPPRKLLRLSLCLLLCIPCRKVLWFEPAAMDKVMEAKVSSSFAQQKCCPL